MRILQLCKKFPYPLNDGESIAVTYLTRALHKKGCEITLLSMNTSKHFQSLHELPVEFDHYKEIHTTYLDNKLNFLEAVCNLFRQRSFHLSRYYNRKFATKLREVLRENKFDIIQLETLYLAPYIDLVREESDALVVMRAHNVEYRIWERLSDQINFLPKKWYIRYLSENLKSDEIGFLKKYDYLVAISDEDLNLYRRLGYKNGAVTTPIGLNLEDYHHNNVTDKTIDEWSFIGSLDWLPNTEGLEWFIEKVVPVLRNYKKDFTLHIAGKNAPSAFRKLNKKGVHFMGETNDSKKFITSFPVMTVPLLAGSGMRAKILEAMALGRIVITTSIGLEGIPAQDRKEVLIADTPSEFLTAYTELHENPLLGKTIQKNAVEFVRNRYCAENIAGQLISSYKDYLKFSEV